MPAAWITAGVGLYNAVNSSGGGGGGQGTGYVPSALQGVDNIWQNAENNNYNQLQYGGGFAQNVDPNIYNAYHNLSGINYNPYLQASNQAGQQYGQLANRAGQAGATMNQQAQGNFAQQQALNQAGQQVFNLGLDPQNALYDRTRQQVTDQSAATNSMYGLGTSGQGAALQNQALGNFNIDWQNQQLSRALAGAQGYAGLSQAGGQLGTLGAADLQASMGYYGQQPGFTQQAAQVPLSAQQYAYGQPFQDAQNFSQALGAGMAPYNSIQNQSIPYMNAGVGASNNAFQNGLAQQQYQQQQLAQFGDAAGNVDWGSVGQAFGSGGSNGDSGSLWDLFGSGTWGGWGGG